MSPSLHSVDTSTALGQVKAQTLSSQRSPERINKVVLKIVAIDFVVILVAAFLTSLTYFRLVLNEHLPTNEYLIAGVAIAGLAIAPAIILKHYSNILAQSRDHFLLSGVAVITLGFSFFVSLLFLFKVADLYSRGTLVCQFFSVLTAILIARNSTYTALQRATQAGFVEARRAVIIGNISGQHEVLAKLAKFGIRTAGVLKFPSFSGSGQPGIQVFSSNVRSFVDRCRALKPDDVIFLAELADLPKITPLVDALSELPVTAHVIPVGLNELWTSATVANLSGTMSIQVLRPPLSVFDSALKRTFDICVATAGLILLAPLLGVVALAIKLTSRGSFIFQQNRHGYNNDIIPVLKFRTMTVMEDGETLTTFKQAGANDPRITSLGHFLRKTNLDELPQLINVLKGEMSIVGPRPHPLALNAIYQDRIAPFSRRHNVKPGLTGWAQVNGCRGETDTFEKMERRIEHDLYYIDNWSFLLDLKIVLMTIFSRSAYLNAR